LTLNKLRDKDPYIKKLEDIGPITVYLVDGNFIRTHIQPQFTVEAHWKDKDYRGIIPANEFWLDVGADPEEYDFLIMRMLEEIKHLSKLVDPIRAEKLASETEQRERNKASRESGIYQRRSDVELSLIQEIKTDYQQDPLNAYVVDGRKIRDKVDILYRHGGHDLVYPDYIPHNHIWIDNTTKSREWDYFLVHELGERKDMYGMGARGTGLGYKKAHAKALRDEQLCRHDLEHFEKRKRDLGIL
jgi:hypothetical protein